MCVWGGGGGRGRTRTCVDVCAHMCVYVCVCVCVCVCVAKQVMHGFSRSQSLFGQSMHGKENTHPHTHTTKQNKAKTPLPTCDGRVLNSDRWRVLTDTGRPQLSQKASCFKRQSNPVSCFRCRNLDVYPEINPFISIYRNHLHNHHAN